MIPLVQLERYVRLQSQPLATYKRVGGQAYRIVELGDTAVGDGQTRQQHQIDEGMYMALFGEVERQGAFAIVARRL